MKRFTWIYALVVPCLAVAGLFAENIAIVVSVDSNGAISYSHKGTHHGNNGHQLAGDGDVITWKRGTNCKSLAVKFKGTSPCSAPGNPCTVSTGNIPVGVYSYSVAADYTDGNGNSAIAISDPDVIVDNVGMIENQGRNAGSKKGSGYKK